MIWRSRASKHNSTNNFSMGATGVFDGLLRLSLRTTTVRSRTAKRAASAPRGFNQASQPVSCKCCHTLSRESVSTWTNMTNRLRRWCIAPLICSVDQHEKSSNGKVVFNSSTRLATGSRGKVNGAANVEYQPRPAAKTSPFRVNL